MRFREFPYLWTQRFREDDEPRKGMEVPPSFPPIKMPCREIVAFSLRAPQKKWLGYGLWIGGFLIWFILKKQQQIFIHLFCCLFNLYFIYFCSNIFFFFPLLLGLICSFSGRKQKQELKEIVPLSCSLQHYSQQLRYANKLSVSEQMNR